MLRLLALLVVFLALAPADALAQPNAASALYVNDGYYPNVDPQDDIARASERARAENKRILIVVGGDWCVWCEILDRYLASNAEVREAFGRSFVMVKVNWSRENKNEAFLGRFPDSAGYPDFFILDSDGQYLNQQRTDVLESGRSYNYARMLAFARQWQVP